MIIVTVNVDPEWFDETSHVMEFSAIARSVRVTKARIDTGITRLLLHKFIAAGAAIESTPSKRPTLDRRTQSPTLDDSSLVDLVETMKIDSCSLFASTSELHYATAESKLDFKSFSQQLPETITQPSVNETSQTTDCHADEEAFDAVSCADSGNLENESCDFCERCLVLESRLQESLEQEQQLRVSFASNQAQNSEQLLSHFTQLLDDETSMTNDRVNEKLTMLEAVHRSELDLAAEKLEKMEVERNFWQSQCSELCGKLRLMESTVARDMDLLVKEFENSIQPGHSAAINASATTTTSRLCEFKKTLPNPSSEFHYGEIESNATDDDGPIEWIPDGVDRDKLLDLNEQELLHASKHQSDGQFSRDFGFGEVTSEAKVEHQIDGSFDGQHEMLSDTKREISIDATFVDGSLQSQLHESLPRLTAAVCSDDTIRSSMESTLSHDHELNDENQKVDACEHSKQNALTIEKRRKLRMKRMVFDD